MTKNLSSPSKSSFITRLTKSFLELLRDINVLSQDEPNSDNPLAQLATESAKGVEDIQENRRQNQDNLQIAVSIKELQRMPITHLSYLLTFDQPRAIDSPSPVPPLFPYAHWETYLGERPAAVAARLLELGALVRADLRDHLTHQFSKAELQALLKARQLPSSGNKAGLIERLVVADEPAMWSVVDELQLFVYTPWAWYVAKMRLEALLTVADEATDIDLANAPGINPSTVRTVLHWLLATAAAGVIGNRVDATIIALVDSLRTQASSTDAPTSPLPTPQPESPLSVSEQYQPRRMRSDRINFDWVTIPAGEFLMGSDKAKDKDAADNELPQHRLYLPEYKIARVPVTVVQFVQFVKATSYKTTAEQAGMARNWAADVRNKQNHPVTYMSWYDAIKFCEWADVRLPSEAEWERAARGTNGRIYPWGNEVPDPSRCNFDRNVGDTTPVGDYPKGATSEGLQDMAGNVWEWTTSLWGKYLNKPDFVYPYKVGDGRENLSAGDDVSRVLRGGSFAFSGYDARCAYHNRNIPLSISRSFGFRVVWSSGG